MQRFILSLAAATLAFATPLRVAAYCRATTNPIPAGYDPTASGCINQGADLVWPSMPVTYQLEQEGSKQVSLASATPVFDHAFARWAAASCPASQETADAAAGHPALSFVNLGPTDAGFAECQAGPCGFTAQAAPHVILFRDQAWPYDDPANTIALTTLTFAVDDGHIFAADMEINSFGQTISTEVPAPPNAYSLEAIATHEAGHFVGLAHSQFRTAVMFAFYQPNEAVLTDDDVAAICAAYPPSSGATVFAASSAQTPSGGGCSYAEGEGRREPSLFPIPALAAAIALISFGRRSWRVP